jgi:two-component system, response regulator PdtaR
MSVKTIVVVEDDPLLRSDAVAMLGAAGLAVVDFETADDAVAYLERRADQVAGVLTDVRMPGRLDGFDLAVKVTMCWPEVTVMMTSGLDRPESLLIPSVAFLPKPWLPLDVLTAMQDAAERV